MKLPWGKEDELEQLRQEIEGLRDEKQSLEKRFEAEKERRSKLARQKQEAEEELNRLRDRLRSLESQDKEEEQDDETRDFEPADFSRVYRMLEKLDSLESPEEDLVTVFSPGKLSEVDDMKGLRNSVDQKQLRLVRQNESFAAFLEPDFLELILKTRPFFEPGWSLGDRFELSPLLEFIESEKTWVLVSAGETKIYREQAGEVKEIGQVKTRVNSKHSSGGYSQTRFERKREEQVQEHLDQVSEALEERENIYLLGEKSLCKELPGEHLGGFDPNLGHPEVFYSFQLLS